MLHGGLWWRPLSLLFKSKLPDILFNILCTGYDLRLRMRRFFIQQAQARRWWIGSLKFAIGLEPPSLRNTAGGLYNFFPVSSFALVLLDRSPWSASFFTPRLWAACGKSSSGCRSVHDGTLLKSLLESGFAWSSYLLISGCFLSVTILYHSPKVSSIRRPHNVYMQYLCIIRIE